MLSNLTEGSLSSHLSDEELVEFFRQSGNQEIIGELFRRYSHLVLGVCLKYLKNRDEARDAAMEVFERLFVALRKYEVHNFKSWLFTVTKSHCSMILRQRKKDGFLLTWEDNLLGEIMENGGFLHLNSEDESEERIRKLHQAMGNLSPGQQQCILLFYFDDKPYLEIEQTTGYTSNEVKSHIQNGKRNLKIALEQHLY
jgi:RNA polymerase sigma-70 factor (ECF subfamily)